LGYLKKIPKELYLGGLGVKAFVALGTISRRIYQPREFVTYLRPGFKPPKGPFGAKFFFSPSN